MITHKEFVILQASLRYAIDELGPHFPESFASYLPNETVLNADLIRLNAKLASAQMSYLDLSSDLLNAIDAGTWTGPVLPTNLATILLPRGGPKP